MVTEQIKTSTGRDKPIPTFLTEGVRPKGGILMAEPVGLKRRGGDWFEMTVEVFCTEDDCTVEEVRRRWGGFMTCRKEAKGQS